MGYQQDPEEFGPEPPVFYATNIVDTAQKWGAAGQDYTFLAESPQAMAEAKAIRAPRIMKGYQEPPPEPPPEPAIGPEPPDGELDEMSQLGQLWDTHVSRRYGGKDPLKINSAEEGMRAEEAARAKYMPEMMGFAEGSHGYRAREKLISEAKRDATKIAEARRKMGEEDHRQAVSVWREKLKENKPKVQKGSAVQSAQQYTERAIFGPNSWRNYELTPEEISAAEANKGFTIKDHRLKPRILEDINRVRELEGLQPIVEDDTPRTVEMRETTNITPWGPKIPFTGTRKFKETRPSRSYKAGQAPERKSAASPAAGTPQVVRYGTYNGRRVAQYQDGRTEYVR